MLTPQEQSRFEELQKSLQNKGLIPPNDEELSPKKGLTPQEEVRFNELQNSLIKKGLISPEHVSSNEEESYLSRFGKQAAKTARNVVGGLGSAVDVPLLAVNIPAWTLGYEGLPSVGENIKHGIDTLTGGLTKPEGHTEKIAEAITEALSGGFGIGKVAGKVLKKSLLKKGATEATNRSDKILRSLQETGKLNASNIVPTATASGMAQHLLNNNPDDQLIALLGGLGTGIGSAGLYHAGKSFATKAGRMNILGRMGELAEINPLKVEAAKDAGLPINAAMVSDSDTVHQAHNILKRTPFGPSKIMKKNEEAILRKIEDITGITQDNHQLLTPDRGGELARKGVLTYHKKESGKQAQYQKVIDNAIENAMEEGSDLVVPTNHLIDFLENQRNALKTSARQKSFDKTIQGKALKELKNSHKKHGGTPLHDLAALEEDILDQVTTFGTLGKKSKSQIENLGNKISKTVDEFKKDLSPEAKKALIEKNAAWATYAQDVRVPHFNQILKKFKTAPREAFDSIFSDKKNMEKKLSPLYEAFNETEAKEFTDIFIKQLGTSKDNEYHGYRMASKFKKLPSQAQKTILSAYKPKMAKQFKKIVETVDHLGERLADENTSKTAYTHGKIEYAKDLGKIAAGAGAAMVAGNPGVALSLAIPVAAGIAFTRFSAKKMTDPKFINEVYQAMTVNRKNASQYVSKIDPKTKYGMLFLRELNRIISG